MEGYKKKKPTKKEMIESIPKFVDGELKKNYIKNITQGYVLANQMILDYMDNHTFDEVREFIKKNVSKDGLETFEKVVQK